MENNKTENSLEFEFDAPEEGGLVFEREDSSGFTFTEQANTPSEKAEQTVEIPEIKEEPKAPEQDAQTDDASEFFLPETFEVNDKYNTPVQSDGRSRIYTTYVPRFTEASENYRMKNDPRPRPKQEEQSERVVVKEAVTVAEPVIEQLKAAPEVKEPEAGALRVETVVVNLHTETKDALDGESYNIFKFDTPAAENTSGMRPDEQSANRRALEELKARQAERRAREEAERLEREAAEREAARVRANTKLSPENYTIPDPEYTSYSDKRSGADNDYDTPHGIPTEPELPKKRRPTEYSRANQRDGFKDRFLDSLVSLRIRIIAAVLLTLSLMLLENHEIFGIDLTKYFGRISGGAIAVVDIQITLCAVLLALPEIVVAIRALARKCVLPELFLVWSLLVSVAYTVIKVAFEYIGAPDFGFVVALSVLLALIASYMRKKADFENFKFVATEGEKRILEHEETRKYPRMMLALDGAVDGYKSNTARTFRTTFVTDFFKSSAKHAENTKTSLIILAISFGAALVTALTTYFVSDSQAIERAVSGFALASLLSLPALSLISHKMLYRYAGKEAATVDCAVIGEAAYTDLARADVIAFEDTEIFGEDDVNLKRFGFYGNDENVNRCMRLTTSLFAGVGGPLSIIFAKTLEKRCTPATDPIIEQDGISARIDGRTVCAGSAEYMLRHGIRIPEDSERMWSVGADSMKTMYGAEDGVVFAKFFIRYSFSEEFTSLLGALRDEHIVPLVYSSDPNVSAELLRTLTMGQDSVRVIKRTELSAAADRVYPRLRANAVTVGDPLSSIRVSLIAKKYKRFSFGVSRAEIVCASTLAVGALAISVAGVASSVPTLILGGIGAVSTLVLSLIAKRKFNSANKNKGK